MVASEKSPGMLRAAASRITRKMADDNDDFEPGDEPDEDLEDEDFSGDFDEEEIEEDDLDLSDEGLIGGSDDDGDSDDEADDSDDDSDDDEDDDEAEALDELEAEELEMLTDDETVETIVVDEAAEMRAIRRAELAMEGEGADGAAANEFVCSSCFLVKRTSQLANKRRKICADCAA